MKGESFILPPPAVDEKERQKLQLEIALADEAEQKRLLKEYKEYRAKWNQYQRRYKRKKRREKKAAEAKAREERYKELRGHNWQKKDNEKEKGDEE